MRGQVRRPGLVHHVTHRTQGGRLEQFARASFRRVELGQRVGSLRVVTSGLTADESVVVEGIQKVRDGEPVTAQETSVDATSLTELLASVPGTAKSAPEKEQ